MKQNSNAIKKMFGELCVTQLGFKETKLLSQLLCAEKFRNGEN